jgi:hypothetical protein
MCKKLSKDQKAAMLDKVEEKVESIEKDIDEFLERVMPSCRKMVKAAIKK